MTVMPTPAPAPAPKRRIDVATVIGSTIAGGLFGYISNVWIMAVRSDGFNVLPGSAAAGPGNLTQGSLFWLLAPTVIFGIAGYWRAVGSQRFFHEIGRLPTLLVTLGRRSGSGFRLQFLLGALVGVLASVVIGPSLGLVMSLGFMAMLPTAASSILSTVGYKVTQFLASRLARPSAATSPEGAGLMSSVVVMFGSASALLLGFFVNSTWFKWSVAGVLVVLMLVQSGRLRGATPTVPMALGLIAGAAILWSSRRAGADDGGWIECAGQSWWSCPGSDKVRQWAGLGGVLGGAGGALGGVLGGVVGGWPGGGIFDNPELLSPDDPANELSPTATDEWIRSALNDPSFGTWAGNNPPSDPMTPEQFDDYMDWRHGQGIDDPPISGDGGFWPGADDGMTAGDAASGVTTAEGVAPPPNLFEGSEGWSGNPASDALGADDFGPDDFGGDDFGGDDVIADDFGGDDFGGGDDLGGETGTEGITPTNDVIGDDPGEEGFGGDDLGGDDLGDDLGGDDGGGGDDSGGDDLGGEEGTEGITPTNDVIGDDPGEEGFGDDDSGGDDLGEPEPDDEVLSDDYLDSLLGGAAGVGAAAGDEGGDPGLLQGDDLGDEGAESQEVPPIGEGETEGEKGDTTRYRPGAEANELAGDPRFDDSMHTIDPDAQATGADGKPLVDPSTGEPLPVDSEGKVKYGDEWVDPETAAKQTAIDATHLAEVEQGKQLVDQFKALQTEFDGETDPGRRAELESALRDKAVEINGDYQAKQILKTESIDEGRTAAVDQYDKSLRQTYDDVDKGFADTMDNRGVKMGGRPMETSDMTEFRNKPGPGQTETSSMDRDWGLDQSKVSDLETKLANAEPGSAEAQQLSKDLMAARKAQEITVDYDKLLEATRNDLANAEPGSQRAQELTDRLDRYGSEAARLKENHLTQLRAELDKVPPGSPEAEAIRNQMADAETRAAGQAESRVSKAEWNNIATDAYNDSYRDTTGADPEKAFQNVTQRGKVDAYADANAPTGRNLDPGKAEQTASVTSAKTDEMRDLAEAKKISDATQIQEDARGTAKDSNKRLIPTLEADPMADPGKVQTLKDITDVLDRAGRGEIPPGQVDSELRKVVPGDPTMNLDKAVKIIDANTEAAIKFQPKGTEGADAARPPAGPETPRTGEGYTKGMAVAGDLAAFDSNRQALIDKGMDPAEATLVAAAQTMAGNQAMDAMTAGGVDPRISMAGGALLPKGVDNVLPDRFAENTVVTGYEGGKAALQSLNDSISTGRIDTKALDTFATGVGDRPGADPFKGYAEISSLAGSESARTDGGNVITDMKQIIETGAGAEVANQSMADFQRDVAAGKHGPALAGLDHLMRIGSELGMDPKGTVGDFISDLKTIYDNGVGEGYWGEAADHTRGVLRDTPLVGHVVKGYEEIGGAAGEIYEGVAQKGVIGFTKDAASDVKLVGGYILDETAAAASKGATAVVNGASNFAGWVKSFF